MGNDTSKETAKSVMPKPPKILIKNNFVGIKGIYHLKVLIRGLRQSGKSTLFSLLQKKEPELEYKPTNTIETANVIWKSKRTGEEVHIELWDVVDKSQVKDTTMTLELLSELTKNDIKQGSYILDSVDAENVNIYNNVDIMIYILDPRRKDSLTYICKDMIHLKYDVPIIILLNFMDRKFEWELEEEDILGYVNSERRISQRNIILIQTALINKYGLDLVDIYIEQYFYYIKIKLLQEEIFNCSSIHTQLNEYMEECINQSSYQEYCKAHHINALKDIPSSLIPSNKQPVQFNNNPHGFQKKLQEEKRYLSPDEFFKDIDDPVTLRNLNFINNYMEEGLSDEASPYEDEQDTFSSSISYIANRSEDGSSCNFVELPFATSNNKALKNYPKRRL